MFGKSRLLLGSALCALTLFGTPALVRADDEKAVKKSDVKLDTTPITIPHAQKAGDATKLRTKVSAEVQGMEIKVEQNHKHVVKEIKKEGDKAGDIVVVIEDEGGKMSFGGQEQDSPAGPATTVTFGKNNKLVAFKAEGGQFFSLESLHLQMISTSLIYPDKAVKSGDKWETEYENPVVKDKKFKVETTYVGKETVDKEELFKLTQKMEADGDENGTKTKVQMTFWLDKEGGIVKSEQKAEGIVTTMAAIDWTATTERIKEKAKEKPADK